MNPDVDLLRLLLLYLETRQVSPRATVLIDLRDEAADLGLAQDLLANSLNLLLDRGYIDGLGEEGATLWLFRKLTTKGVEFVRAARDPAAWAKIKQRQESHGSAGL